MDIILSMIDLAREVINNHCKAISAGKVPSSVSSFTGGKNQCVIGPPILSNGFSREFLSTMKSWMGISSRVF